jgi:hypothetical protein
VAEHGIETPGGLRLQEGRAEVEVGYLERLPTGRLREPVARAVRAVGGNSGRPSNTCATPTQGIG